MAGNFLVVLDGPASPACSLSRGVLLEASHGSASPVCVLSPATLLASCMHYVYDIDDSYLSVHLARFLVVPDGPSSPACSMSPVLLLAGRLRDECDKGDGAYFSSQLS